MAQTSWGCLLLLDRAWCCGRKSGHAILLFCRNFSPFLVTCCSFPSICISHLQSRHSLFILSLCPIQSQPVFGSLCLFHCLIWRARLFFAAQPQWSLGAWGRRLVTLVWPSPPSQPAIKIGGRGWGFQPSLRVTHTLRLLWVTDGCTAPLTFLRTTYDSWESKGASQLAGKKFPEW